ncbi:MAG TPA: YkgJ family cysteine cluster protein [Candidatus Acidoferrum sp.]|jgi:Fe-S-cluster containining protein|nr:YkgJ family cysteine cluster protein [Candidatus Acidoferrum sp.]
METDADRPLLLPDNVVFTCQQSGACCRSDWLIGVDDAAHARLRDVRWERHDPALDGGEAFVPLPFPLASGERVTFARRASGACVFLTEDTRCAIHRHLGAAAKPQVCREFPYHFVQTPDGVAVGVSFACTAVRAHHGATLPAQRDEVRAVLAGSTRVERLPRALTLFGSVDIGWEEYRPIEAGLLELLAPGERAFPVALLAGSALLSLCIGLTQIEARARRAGQPPPTTLTAGLAELKADGYRRLLDIAAGARYPRRPSLAYLAPTYTWLQFSRRRMSRAALLLSLYRNYFRFRSARGRLPDVITGGEPFDLEAVLRIRVDADAPGVDAFLREYWSHVIFRKTLTPMHGIFRGYQTLLALYSFMKLAARLHAWRAGRPAAALADVKEAVRLVERAFVLHARYTDLFRLTPMVTILADRLYQQPSFVRTAALEA